MDRFAARILDRENSHRLPSLLQSEDLVQDERLRQPRPRADHVPDCRPLLRLILHKLFLPEAQKGGQRLVVLHPSEELRSPLGSRTSTGPPPAAAPASLGKDPLDRAHRSGASGRVAELSSFAPHWVRCEARQGPSSSGAAPQTKCCNRPCRQPDRPQRCSSDSRPHRARFEPADLVPRPPALNEPRAAHSPPLPSVLRNR